MVMSTVVGTGTEVVVVDTNGAEVVVALLRPSVVISRVVSVVPVVVSSATVVGGSAGNVVSDTEVVDVVCTVLVASAVG